MKKIISLIIVFFCINISIKAQNTTFNNVSIGTDAPAYGIKISANFPGQTGGWARGFFVTNETGGQNYITLGSTGFMTNGITNLLSSYIGSDYNNQYMTFLPNGNIGIGTTPSEKFEIYNSNTSPAIISLKSDRNDYQYVDVGRISAKQNLNEISRIAMARADGSSTGYLTFWTKADNNESLTEKLRISPNGNVGIGTTNPTSKLTVAGNINSREVKVMVDAGADFVFENDYNLPTLTSVDKFIKENKHLPEIASAAEMRKDGINLSEMNIKLLQKIEELTLYSIEQNKKIEILEKKVESLLNK